MNPSSGAKMTKILQDEIHPANVTFKRDIRPLGLNPQQQSDLVAFLRNALSDPRVITGTAPFDRPTLYSESNRVPQITGAGTQGSGGNIPQATAIEPPLVGNPNFTVGISNALGAAQAVLVDQ